MICIIFYSELLLLNPVFINASKNIEKEIINYLSRHEDQEEGKLFVGGLSCETTQDTLLRYFSRFHFFQKFYWMFKSFGCDLKEIYLFANQKS